MDTRTHLGSVISPTPPSAMPAKDAGRSALSRSWTSVAADSTIGLPPTWAGSLLSSVGSIRRPYRPTVPLGQGVATMSTSVPAGGGVTTATPQPDAATATPLTRRAASQSRRGRGRGRARPSELTAHHRVSFVVHGEKEPGPDPELGSGRGRDVLPSIHFRIRLDCREPTGAELAADRPDQPQGIPASAGGSGGRDAGDDRRKRRVGELRVQLPKAERARVRRQRPELAKRDRLAVDEQQPRV